MEDMINMMKQNGAEMDPAMTMLAQMMNNQKTETSSNNIENEHTPEINKVKLIKKLKVLNQENKQLRDGLDQLLSLNDDIASLLGACSDCYGKDAQCITCKGKGLPGYYEFDKDLFLEFIGNCLTKISMEQQN